MRSVAQYEIEAWSLRQYLTGSQHTERVHEIVETAVNNMKHEKGPFDIEKHMFHIVLNVLHVLCFGSTIAVDSEQFSKLHYLFNSTGATLTNNWEDAFPFLRHFPSKKFKNLVKVNGEFREYLEDRVKEGRATFDENNVTTLVDNILVSQRQLEKGNNAALQARFTNTNVVLTMSSVFFAGTDTSRHTLAWLFLYLAKTPDVQKKIHAEIDATVGDAAPSREHRPGLVYTEAAIQEILRLFPAVPMGLPHETLRDTHVWERDYQAATEWVLYDMCVPLVVNSPAAHGGFDIPAKTKIMVNQYAILRDPNNWDQPDSFIPERYLDKARENPSIKGKKVPFKPAPRQLSVYLCRQLTFNKHIEEVSKSATSKMKMIRAVSNSKWGWGQESLKKVYQMFAKKQDGS
ncbi:cytochrome P450 1A1-like [Aplysia californica]|uniref:Cytochrome P450 1A1-like n=1 Tax=Aplysia californica TaxID=6500 RepID=A0ABM0JHP7_APLCA|nr:cytochrome P450 1A1-like [Aplysia californica]